MKSLALAGMSLAALLADSAALQAKTLVYCSEGSPENFSPALNTTGTSFDAARPIYNKLTEFERGSTKVVPGLAEQAVVIAVAIERIGVERTADALHIHQRVQTDAGDLRGALQRQIHVHAIRRRGVTRRVPAVAAVDVVDRTGPREAFECRGGRAAVERIEILRGPASTLYGSDALAGVVAFRTREPQDLLAQGGGNRHLGLRVGWDGMDESFLRAASWAGESASARWQGMAVIGQRSAHWCNQCQS